MKKILSYMFPCNDGAVIRPGIQCRLHCYREEREEYE